MVFYGQACIRTYDLLFCSVVNQATVTQLTYQQLDSSNLVSRFHCRFGFRLTVGDLGARLGFRSNTN